MFAQVTGGVFSKLVSCSANLGNEAAAQSLCQAAETNSFPHMALSLSSAVSHFTTIRDSVILNTPKAFCTIIPAWIFKKKKIDVNSPAPHYCCLCLCSLKALSQMSTSVVEVWQPEDAEPLIPIQVNRASPFL